MKPLAAEQINTKPPADLVKQVRERHGLTQPQCAAIVGLKMRAWQGYESGERGMLLPIWWLFLLRINEITESELPATPQRQRAGAIVMVGCG